jgi:hypothetical protein
MDRVRRALDVDLQLAAGDRRAGVIDAELVGVAERQARGRRIDRGVGPARPGPRIRTGRRDRPGATDDDQER